MADSDLTAARLRELLHYDPETGIFTWVKSGPGRKASPGWVHISFKSAYLRISLARINYFAHRLAWLYMTGEWPELIDHIDGNGINNKWANLRKATRQQNAFNTVAPCSNSSGFKHVHADKRHGNYRVIIAIDGRRHFFGSYDDPELAGLVAAEAAAKLHGAFARV